MRTERLNTTEYLRYHNYVSSCFVVFPIVTIERLTLTHRDARQGWQNITFTI